MTEYYFVNTIGEFKVPCFTSCFTFCFTTLFYIKKLVSLWKLHLNKSVKQPSESVTHDHTSWAFSTCIMFAFSPHVSVVHIALWHMIVNTSACHMPQNTERQALTDILLERYIVQHYAECFMHIAAEILAIDGKEPNNNDNYHAFFISESLLQCLRQFYSKRYLEKHVKIPKSTDTLCLILTEYKKNQPDIFWIFMCFSSNIWQLSAIYGHAVFENESQNKQAPVEIQLAVALHHFGHFENTVSLLRLPSATVAIKMLPFDVAVSVLSHPLN
jgi:hypothetical protein